MPVGVAHTGSADAVPSWQRGARRPTFVRDTRPARARGYQRRGLPWRQPPAAVTHCAIRMGRQSSPPPSPFRPMRALGALLLLPAVLRAQGPAARPDTAALRAEIDRRASQVAPK